MGKKKVALIDLSQSEKAQLKASGVRSQKIKIKPAAPSLEIPPAPEKKTEAKPETKTKVRVKHPRSRQYLESKAKIDKKKAYQVSSAIKLLRSVNLAKFDATVDLHCNLSVEKLAFELTLPHACAKTQKIEIATDSTLAKLNDNIIDFDVLIATPQMMPKLAKFAKTLGPKGLMPNPKAGTISDQPEAVKKKLEGGATRVKSEPKAPLLHLSIGKLSFKDEELEKNLNASLDAIKIKNIDSAYLCSSMSPSIKLELKS